MRGVASRDFRGIRKIADKTIDTQIVINDLFIKKTFRIGGFRAFMSSRFRKGWEGENDRPVTQTLLHFQVADTGSYGRFQSLEPKR
jgi:hypothetical protein